MKNFKLIAISLFLIALNAKAQTESKKDKIKALKVAFITNELSLTSDEATKFWPVFNVFEAKQKEIRSSRTKNFLYKMSDEDLEILSDKDANSLLAQIETTEEELLSNRKKLTASLKSILSPIKILKLKRAEDNFGKKLLEQYKKSE